MKISKSTLIEPLSAVNPSTYNPRTADPKRLNLIELSLRKLGFIAPIYADANGEILSGHQRHFVATRMGVKNVPVFKIPPMELEKRKALNIVFNRATNDGDICQTPEKAKRELETLNLSELAKNIQEKELESKEFFRCAYPSKVSVAKLCKVNSGRWIQYAKSIARTLRKAGIIMPIVCTPDGKVINGIGRLEMLAELKADACDVVYISEEEAKFADAMMNLLTMDFNIHERYEDLLRYNSFRRARRVREELGHGFVFAVHGNKPCHSFDIFDKSQQAKWRREHGNSILDFGAGHLTETNILNAAGFDCTPFEPYHIGVSEMSGNVCAKCENVRRIPWERLEEALQFEFDLPYPDGSRMGLVDDAVNAFKRRYDGIAV